MHFIFIQTFRRGFYEKNNFVDSTDSYNQCFCIIFVFLNDKIKFIKIVMTTHAQVPQFSHVICSYVMSYACMYPLNQYSDCCH